MDYAKEIIENINKKNTHWFQTQKSKPGFREFVSRPEFNRSKQHPVGPIHHARGNPKILAILFSAGANPNARVRGKGGNYHTLLGSLIV